MSEELFPSSEVSVESPRLKWIAAHAIRTSYTPGAEDCGVPWNCWAAGEDWLSGVECGATEDDAIAAWARNNGVLLWSEESLAKPKGGA